MDKVTCSAFQRSIKDLSYIELTRLNQKIKDLLSKDEVGQVLAKHENKISNCPHCNSYVLSLACTKESNIIAVIVAIKHSVLLPQQVWSWVKQNEIANRVFKDDEDIIDKCSIAWNHSIADTKRVISLCSRDWAKLTSLLMELVLLELLDELKNVAQQAKYLV